MNEFINSFYDFCLNPSKPSGKASSYCNAIKYLGEFLDIDIVGVNDIPTILRTEPEIKNINSNLYKELFSFLKQRNQLSYLEKGFMKAAITQLKKYYKRSLFSQLKTPIFFANLTWMERYDGLESFERSGMSWVRTHKDAGEKFNFKDVDGRCYGFVESKNKKINITRISDHYGCKIEGPDDNRYINNVLIVFFSNKQDGKSKIVGFYENATVYENVQTNALTNSQYYFTCYSKDALLIPEEDRKFPINKHKDGINNYGQSTKWYADEIEHVPFINEVVALFNSYKTKYSSRQEFTESLSLTLINDAEILSNFNPSKLQHSLPTINSTNQHNYSERKFGGTVKESKNKIYSGRKAEKYFIDFLKSKSFVENLDFADVANNKAYCWDIQFSDIGLEIKNIRSGSFFLSDNEIAYLQNKKTHLILVDIDNGIWLLKNNSKWLSDIIQNIKDIRNYSALKYKNLDLDDIRILLDDSVKQDAKDISECEKEELLDDLLT